MTYVYNISWCKSSLDSQKSSNAATLLHHGVMLSVATPTTPTPVPFWSPHPGTAMMKPPAKKADGQTKVPES